VKEIALRAGLQAPWRSRIHLFALILTALAIKAHCAPPQNPYDEAMKQVRVLSNYADVRLLPFGKTSTGRMIPAFVISNFSTNNTGKARVLICAGQHGDEYNPVKSILSFSRELADGTLPDLLERCVVIVVPMVNPDGIAAKNRFNADGQDLNRDWIDRITRETQFVNSLIRTWQPQAMIDIHEWTGPSPVPANEIELSRCVTTRQQQAMASLAAGMAAESGLTLIKCTVHSDGRLFHRKYSMQGYAAYLIETAPGETFNTKNRAYVNAIETIANALAAKPAVRGDLSPSSVKFNPELVSAYLEPAQINMFADPTAEWLGFASLAVILYCLVSWIMKPLVKSEESWSHKFRMCSIDPELAAGINSRRRTPQPITSKSWAHRRLRARYTREENTTTSHKTSQSTSSTLRARYLEV